MSNKLHNSNLLAPPIAKSSKTLFAPKMRRIFLENMALDRNAVDYMEFKRVIRNMPKHTRKAGNAK